MGRWPYLLGAATCLPERPHVSAFLHLYGQRTHQRRGPRTAVDAVLLDGVHGRGAGEAEVRQRETPARNSVPVRVGAQPRAGAGAGRHGALGCKTQVEDTALLRCPPPVSQCMRPLLRFGACVPVCGLSSVVPDSRKMVECRA